MDQLYTASKVSNIKRKPKFDMFSKIKKNVLQKIQIIGTYFPVG